MVAAGIVLAYGLVVMAAIAIFGGAVRLGSRWELKTKEPGGDPARVSPNP